MQYTRLYLNEDGDIEHAETSDRPLPSIPAIEIHEPDVTGVPIAGPNGLEFPLKRKLFNIMTAEHSADDAQFMRAGALRANIEIDKATMTPKMKAGPRTQITFSKVSLTRHITEPIVIDERQP